MAITISDIAHATGVGRATVSRALRGVGYVSKEKKVMVLAAAKKLGYQPNQMARSLASGQSSFVGFMVTFNLSPALHTIIEPVERALREAGYPTMFYSPIDSPDAQTVCLNHFIQNRVGGVIAVPGVSSSDITLYQRLLDNGTKVVVLDRYMEGVQAFQVFVDGYQATRAATEYLISLGHRRIVHLGIPGQSFAARQQAAGFQDAMADAGIPIASSSSVSTEINEVDGYRAMRRLLRRESPPTAVTTRHDLVAFGVMRAVFAAGLSVPEDVSVTGLGDVWDSNMLRVPLTTMRYPFRKMARIGVKALLDMLAGRDVEAKAVALHAKLMVRTSCAPPRRSA